MRTQQEDGQPQAKERGLRKNQTCWHLNLGLLTSRTVKSNLLLFKTPSLWDFVMAACCAVPTVLHLPSCAKEELRASDRDSDDLLNWASYKPEAKVLEQHPTTYGCTAKGRQDTAAIFAIQQPGGGGCKLEGAWCQKSSFIARAAKARTALFLLMAEYTGPF